MPSSINGCGTKYYGQRDFHADGSHVTTNFFCLLFVPLVPIHSVRVIPDPKNSIIPFSKNYYQILEKRWPHPLQVMFVYLSAAFAVAMGIVFFAYIDPWIKAQAPSLAHDWVEMILFFATLTPIWLVARWMSIQAKKRVPSESIDPSDPTPIA